MRIKKYSLFITILMLLGSMLFLLTQSAYAGVSLGQTRIVYHQKNKSQTIQVLNDSDTLYLAQSTVMSALSEPNKTASSFAIIPPLTRIEPRSETQLKLLPKSLGTLPTDRESLFFFAVQFIPESKRSTENVSTSNINVMTKIILKLIYRPTAVTSDPESVAPTLKIKSTNTGVKLENPSAHYLTLVNLRFDGQPYVTTVAPMVAPMSTLQLEVNHKAKTMTWQVLNDFGGLSPVITSPIE